MGTKLLLIRHGQTSWNADGRWQGWAPVPLNATGREQAKAVGDYLLTHYVVSHIYCSDLPRALQTAEIISSVLAVPLTADNRLRGPHVGAWQGLTMDEVIAWDGVGWNEYDQDRHHYKRPGGESLAETAVRCMHVINEAVQRADSTTLAVVTHSGALYAVLRNLKLQIPEDVKMLNTSITELVFDDTTWRLISVAQVPHQ